LKTHDVFIGNGSIKELPALLESKKIKKVLVFRGKSSFEKIKNTIDEMIKGCVVDYYLDFATNPIDDDLQKALRTISGNYDAIIAVGGGSVIDFAKLFNFKSGRKLFFIAIPTTAGSGSEATKFAVIWIKDKKYSIEDDTILPNYAIVDSQFLKNSPKYLKACSSFDAFAQSVESFWSVRSTPRSQEYAKEAMILCKENIVNYVLSDDEKTMDKMSQAAFLAGKAINISKTTAAHALSYVFTKEFNIPHGHAVALSFPKLFAANTDIPLLALNDKREIAYIERMKKSLKEILSYDYFVDVLAKIGLELNLKKLGISNVSDLVKKVNLERISNNPRIFTQAQLEGLFFND
jgi:alcohol dehydrogenase class IV